MEYISENHRRHLLICHLIFICNYQKKLLLKVGDDIQAEIESTANHYGCVKSITHIFLSIFEKNEPFGLMDIFLGR